MMAAGLRKLLGAIIAALFLALASSHASAQSLDQTMEGAALDLWRGFQPSAKQTIAVSTIRPSWLNIDDATFRRANNALERAILRIGQGRGHTLLARTALHNVVGELEESGLGRDVEALRLELLNGALADVLIVADYYVADEGLFMSLQAVRIEDAQVFSSTREYLLPFTPGVVAKKDSGAPAKKKGFVPVANTSSRIVARETDSFSARDCAECPEMVVLPSGGFMMGSPESEERRSGNEGPVRRVFVPKPFAVSKYEVTFDEWDACAAVGGCNGYRPDDEGWGRGARPVVNVSWEDAKRYTEWLSRKTGKAYRLLSEAEWEYVARAGSDTNYSFGDDEKDLCDHGNGAAVGYPINTYSSNDSNKTCKDGYGRQSAPVGSFQANAFGLHDVHGNVKEWVEDCWQDNYNGAPTDGTARTETWIGAWISSRDCSRRVRRGGSWDIGPKELRTAKRGSTHIEGRWGDLGFRVARRLHPQQ